MYMYIRYIFTLYVNIYSIIIISQCYVHVPSSCVIPSCFCVFSWSDICSGFGKFWPFHSLHWKGFRELRVVGGPNNHQLFRGWFRLCGECLLSKTVNIFWTSIAWGFHSNTSFIYIYICNNFSFLLDGNQRVLVMFNRDISRKENLRCRFWGQCRSPEISEIRLKMPAGIVIWVFLKIGVPQNGWWK